jgi:hypothetical protein
MIGIAGPIVCQHSNIVYPEKDVDVATDKE